MKRLSFTLLLALLSTLAFAQAPTSTSQEESSTETSQDIMVTPVGFDKVLSLLLFDVESTQLEISLSQASTGFSFKTVLTTQDSEVVEMDLNDFEGGTYVIEISVGTYTTQHTLILP